MISYANWCRTGSSDEEVSSDSELEDDPQDDQEQGDSDPSGESDDDEPTDKALGVPFEEEGSVAEYDGEYIHHGMG